MQNWYAALAGIVLLAVAFWFSQTFFKVPEKSADKTFTNEYGLVLHDYNGNEVHLYSFRRDVLVAYAWASWCAYCGDEMKRLAALKEKYNGKITIVAINRAEPKADAKAFTDKLGVDKNMTLLLDPDDSFFKSIGGYAMPETVFIDPGGNIVYHQRGPLDEAAMEARIKELVH